MRPVKVAIQGIAASYHHEASRLFLKENIEIVECTTFANVCEALTGNGVDYAIMAIENSIAGSILSNYNLIRDYNFSVTGEIYLRISFYLLANKGVRLEDIKQIETHPMAIAQCSGFLNTLPFVKLIEGNDTASCAKKIHENGLQSTATIAGIEAARLYNLEVLQSNIEDNKQNYTRFLIIAKENPGIENPDKCTIGIQLQHKQGQLLEVLKIIKCNNMNLTKIQSVPILGRPSEYSFYIDMEWEKEEEYENTLRELKKVTSSLSVLGKYKKHTLQLVDV